MSHSELWCKSYLYKSDLFEEYNIFHTNKVVSFPIQSKSHYVLLCRIHCGGEVGVKHVQRLLQAGCCPRRRSFVNVVQRSTSVPTTTYSMSISSLIYTHDTDENMSQMTSALG